MFDDYIQKNKKGYPDINDSAKKNINLLPNAQPDKVFKAKSRSSRQSLKGSALHIPSTRSKNKADQPTSWLAKIKALLVSKPSLSSEKSNLPTQKSPSVNNFSHPSTPLTSKSQKLTSTSRLAEKKDLKKKAIDQPPKSPVQPLNNSTLPQQPTKRSQEPLPQPKIKFHKIKDAQQADDLSDLEVNLLPAQKKHFTQSQVLITYFVIIAILSLLTIMPYINYFTQNRSLEPQIKILQEQVKLSQAKNKEISQQALDLKPFWLKLQVLKDLLENHIYWDNFFQSLEAHTAANVYFTHLNVSSDSNLVELSGQALRLRDVAEQLIIFQNSSDFHEVTLDNLSFLDQETEHDPGFEFSISFKLDPQFIRKSETKDSQSVSIFK